MIFDSYGLVIATMYGDLDLISAAPKSAGPISEHTAQEGGEKNDNKTEKQGYV